MNDRDDIRGDLSALIDGALDPDRQREVEEAVEKDPALRAEYRRLLRVDALYSELPREAAPENFAQGVRAAIARRESITGAEPPQRPMKLRLFTQTTRRSVFWPVAAAATLLVGFFLWSTVNTANRSSMMLSMQQSAPAKAADLKAKDEQLYKVRMLPEEAKSEAPASAPVQAQEAGAPAASPPPPAMPAPEALTEMAEKKEQGQVLTEQAPPTADSMPALEPLRKEDRERALGRMMAAKQAAPAAAAAPAGDRAAAPAPAAEAAGAGAGPQAGAAAPENAAEQRKVAGRVFLRTDAGWVDQAYQGEVLTPLEVDSDEYKQLLPTHPPLEKVAELGGTITLRIDGVWRDFKTGRPVAESQ